jgi:excisionase family DNA binding protein
MPKPKLRPTREAAKIPSVSFTTVKKWIYNGKLRTVKTLGRHHRVLEEDIERLLRSRLVAESRNKCRSGPEKVSESNQLLGCIPDIKVDGLMAQVTILVDEHELTSLMTADAASELELRTGVADFDFRRFCKFTNRLNPSTLYSF